ncbi:MAG: hypothetical protein ACNYZI_02920, partial [Anaerolineales bacterium]
NGEIKLGKRGIWISLCCGFLILGLAACNLPGTGADDPEPTVMGGESQDVELGQQEQALKKVNCPTDASLLYELLYDHELVLNLNSPDVGDESFYLEEEEQQPAYFYFWIEPSGKVSSEGLPNSVTINVSGSVKSDSGSCPVQQLEGSWLLSANITGTCKKGVVTLKVVEQYENTELTGSCGDPITAPGPTSGPELTLTFNLSDPGSTDGLISGSSGDPMYAFYWYQFRPSDLLFNTPQTPSP